MKFIEDLKRRDEKAFRHLLERYCDSVYKAVFAILRDEKDAEDAVQEVFLKIYRSLPGYQSQGLKTWITRIAVNHAIDIRRMKVRMKEEMKQSADMETAAPLSDNTEMKVINNETKTFVHTRLQEMPANYREVIYSYYIQEKSYKEIAREQCAEIKTIETRLYRARNWMKKHWKEEDFS